MLISSFLNRSNSAMRSDWSMSPWIWPTAKPERLRLVASSRTVVLRLQKTIAFLNSSCSRMSRSASLLLVGADLDQALLDVDVGGRRAGDLDPLGIAQELGRQLLDRRRHGRREQQGLPVLGQLRADFLDVGDEAHVEHPVGLVDDQQLAVVEHDLAAAEQVHQPAGRGDQHVDALFQRLDLVAHLNAADQQRHRERVVFAVFLEILGNLHRQLARRLEDQRARHPRPAAAMVRGCRSSAGRSRRSCRCRSGRCRQCPCPSAPTESPRAGSASARHSRCRQRRGAILQKGRDRRKSFKIRNKEGGRAFRCAVPSREARYAEVGRLVKEC